uniref:Uncharacterized protein n=1 Tax=Arundo donax TaxID=35708 RepID=A0A0A9BFL8_ARUDO
MLLKNHRFHLLFSQSISCSSMVINHRQQT